MGSFCSNGTDYINETDTDLDLTPLDNTYQFVFKKEGKIITEKNSKFYIKYDDESEKTKNQIETRKSSIRFNPKEYINGNVKVLLF